MIKPDTMRRFLLPAALAAALALAGCGIKGPLELPSDAQQASATASGDSADSGTTKTAATSTGTGKSRTGKGEMSQASQLPGYQPTAQDKKTWKPLGKPTAPDQPFVLDPLLN